MDTDDNQMNNMNAKQMDNIETPCQGKVKDPDESDEDEDLLIQKRKK